MGFFKKILTTFCEHRIPERTIWSQFQPPWYDTECDKLRREKEKWHIKARDSGNESDHNKFREYRKLLNTKKKLMKKLGLILSMIQIPHLSLKISGIM